MANYIVFGASGTIGSQLSKILTGSGNRVLLAGRDEAKLTGMAADLDMPYALFEASDGAQIDTCFGKAVEAFGQVDGFAHCVGSLLLKPAHLTTDQEWQEVMGVNLSSAFYAVRSGAKTMLKNGGSIVLVSSAAARVGLFNHEAIAAAKAGIQGLAVSAAATYARQNIRVNAVAPGLVRTQMTRRLTANEAAEKASTAMHALGRLGEPEDIARTIAWLLDTENSWITGQVIGVDGGLATVRSRSS